MGAELLFSTEETLQRVVLVGADAREETLEMLEKLKMAGVQVSRGGAERGMTRSIHE